MKIKELPSDEPEDNDEDDAVDVDLEDRSKDYSEVKYVQKQLAKIYTVVEKAFEDKQDQTNLVEECWDIYNCTLNENQAYIGTSQIYVPIVRDAMAARETRFINMLFPQSGRYADVIAEDGHTPYDLIALLDYYVSQAKLRNNIVPAMIRAGDISGNYALYVEWGSNSRFIVSKEKVPEILVEGKPVDGSPEYDDVTYEEVKDQKMVVSVLDVRNLAVLPTQVDDIEDAEIVAIALRYTEEKIKQCIRDGIFTKEAGKALLRNMMSTTSAVNQTNTAKKAASAAGVKTDSKGNKTALIYQVWTKLKLKGEQRMMVAHFAGQDLYLGCKRNPYWNDRVPVLLQAVEKEGDSIWGKSQVEPVKAMQYGANDAANMGMDSAQYALLPIVMTDPEKNPQVGSMILSMAAIWATDPNSTKFANFPALWKDSMSLVANLKEQIQQSLGVNASMIPHGNGAKKPSQAEVAQAQQVALESVNDNISILEAILSQLLEWCYDLDYQYRTKAITVKKFGQLGLQASMDQVEPFQTRQRLTFKWYGVEATKAMQQVQQMISWGNVLKGMPPQLLNGRKVDLGPMLEYITEVTCGPRIAPHVLVDQRHQLSVDFEMENELMENMFPVQVHDMDDDVAHIQAHMAKYQQHPIEYIKGHILEHIQQLKKKAAAQQQSALPAPGGQGGAGGAPRSGAQVQPPTGAQNPPGAVHPDQMPMAPPRK
jgi:hypothetical protein